MRQLVSITALAALQCVCFASSPALAQTRTPGTPPAPTLSVSGEGTVSRAPDRATLAIEIVTNSDSATSATGQNNTIYAALRTRFAAVGIAESAIKTTSFGMNFVPKPTDAAQYKPPRTGYVVTRGLSVTIDNLDNVGKTIDAAVAGGATDLGGVSYGLRDQRSAYASALAAAMHDAETQASALADAAHMHLGTLRNVNAGGAQSQLPVPMFRTMAAQAAPPTQIQPSAVEVHATVSATYFLTK